MKSTSLRAAAMSRLSLVAVAIAVTLWWSGGETPCLAGPARYDPATRSFGLTYTYAALPSFGMSPDQIEALGALQKATEEQDARVRSLQQAVSQVLTQVTDGRARIGSLEYVDSIKKADLIISLTGNPGRGGWAIPGGIEGRPGQVGLYYLNLISDQNQDIVYTVAHELCHYLFALPDEYSNGSLCPQTNPTGPGCLMDNYFNRHGFLELCRDPTHNPTAPFQGTVIQGHTAAGSCRHWVDKFFETHPPGPATTGDPNADDTTTPVLPVVSADDAAVTPSRPFSGKFQLLVDSAVSKVRTDLATSTSAAAAAKETPSALATRAKKFAKDFLDAQLPLAAETPGYVPPTAAQLKQAMDLIVTQVTSSRIKAPTRIDPEMVARLKDKAKEIAQTNADPQKEQFLKLLLTGQGNDPKKLKPVIDLVRKELIHLLITSAKVAILGAPPKSAITAANLTEEEKRYIDQIARDAVIGSSPSSSMGVFQDAALLHIRLTLNASATINAIASELDLPGIKGRNSNLGDLEQQLKDKLKGYALPGKPFTGFGFRRTYVVAPLPQDTKNDNIRIDAGDNIAYTEFRSLAAGELIRMLRRERIEYIDETTMAGAAAGSITPRSATSLPVRTATATTTTTAKPGDRFLQHEALINRLITDIRRDRVENIIIMAPPGGLSLELGDALEDFRNEIVNDPYSDVRVDLILFDLGNVPLRLRDLVARTGGVVQSISDIDEVGTAAQRIKNAFAAGSWVTHPQSGVINLSEAARKSDRPSKMMTPQPLMDLDEIREQFVTGKPAQRRTLIVKKPMPKGDDKAKPEDEVGTDDRSRLQIQADSLATFPVSELELDHFNTRLGLIVQQFVLGTGRPEDYASVANTMANISILQGMIVDLKNQLKRLKLGNKQQPFREDLGKIVAAIQKTKQQVRATLGIESEDISPLTDTNDYLEWQARRSLVGEARAMRVGINEFPERNVSVKSRTTKMHKVAYFLERATELNQRLSDLRRGIFDKENSLFDNDQIVAFGRADTRATKGPTGRDLLANFEAAVHDLRIEADTLQTRETHRSPQLGGLLMESARVLDAIVQERITAQVNQDDPDNASKRTVDPSDQISDLLDLEKLGSVLDRASRQPVNLAQLDAQVDSLNELARKIWAEDPQIDPKSNEKIRPARAAARDATTYDITPEDMKIRLRHRGDQLEKLVTRLKSRIEDLRNLRGALGVEDIDPADAADQSPPLRPENALSPLRRSLKFDLELRETMKSILDSAAKNEKDHETRTNSRLDAPSKIEQWFGISTEDQPEVQPDMIRLKVDEVIYGDFPLLMLDMMGRIKSFEAQLEGLSESVHEEVERKPVFERLKAKRVPAQATTSQDGKTIEIEFESFRAEEGANVEFVIGFSRPLRHFEALKQNPPSLQFFQEGKLVEKAYLGFERDISTETMLVFNIPKPDMRVGIIGAGLFTPKMTLSYDNLPVLGRDNVLDFTFSVGTPRPNVQLITSLRQPQPKVGNLDLANDPERAFRGTLAADQLEAIIEVQVLAGASIIGADVVGGFQRFDASNDPIEAPTLKFLDDGVAPDLQANDGVYTRSIPLLPNSSRKSGEYRVMIEARSDGKQASFIPIVEPIPADKKTEDQDHNGVTDKDPNVNLPKIPPFQRATSLNFHVSSEN